MATILEETSMVELLIKCSSVEEAMSLAQRLVPLEHLDYPISRWFDEVTATVSPEDLAEAKTIIAATNKDIQA